LPSATSFIRKPIPKMTLRSNALIDGRCNIPYKGR
jgi:hypothetical protein